MIRLTERKIQDAPPEEAGNLRLLATNLQSMATYASHVTDCVRLFRYLYDLENAEHGWIFVPAKGAIVEVYNYAQALDAVYKIATRISTNYIKRHIDTKKLERTKQEFYDRFPNTRELRQSILHGAELSGSKERAKETLIRIPVRLEMVSGIWEEFSGAPQCNLMGDKLQMTFAGNAYQQEVSIAVAEAIALEPDPKLSRVVSAG